jgi:hypothetical protein
MLMIGGGLLLDEPMLGLVAASGAFSAGFGVFQRLSAIETLPMLLAASGMTVSAALGTLAGVTPWVEALAAAAWAFAVGLTAVLGTAAWWVTLQWSIALVLAASFPADVAHALLRGVLVAAGAIAQLIITPMLWRLAGRHFTELNAPQAREIEIPQLRSALRQALRWGSPNLRHAGALAIAVGASTILFRKTGLPNGYWMPMTVLIVLRSSFDDTVAFALARIGGTVAGAGVVTLAIALSRPSPPYLVLLSAAFAWGCYALLRVNYAIFTFCITGYVAVLFALAGLPEQEIALYRIVATALGGGIALIASRLFVEEGQLARDPRK